MYIRTRSGKRWTGNSASVQTSLKSKGLKSVRAPEVLAHRQKFWRTAKSSGAPPEVLAARK
jgi:hypothetical protein